MSEVSVPQVTSERRQTTVKSDSLTRVDLGKLPDADENQTLAWRSDWLMAYPDANVAEPKGDDDKDGITNYQEMLAGTNPGKIQPATNPPVTLPHESHESVSVKDVSNHLQAIAVQALADRPKL